MSSLGMITCAYRRMLREGNYELMSRIGYRLLLLRGLLGGVCTLLFPSAQGKHIYLRIIISLPCILDVRVMSLWGKYLPSWA